MAAEEWEIQRLGGKFERGDFSEWEGESGRRRSE